MSDINPPVKAATGVDPDKATEGAVDKAEEHNPMPQPSGPPQPTPAPASNPSDGLDRMAALEALTERLSESLVTLTDTVTHLASRVEPDVPAADKVPWTHRGSKRHE